MDLWLEPIVYCLMLSEFTTNVVSKQEIEQKSKEANQLELVKEMSKLSKVKHLVGEEFEKKGYLENRNIAQARVKFSERVNMFYCKMNYRNDPVFKEQCWTCDSCQSAIDYMSWYVQFTNHWGRIKTWMVMVCIWVIMMTASAVLISSWYWLCINDDLIDSEFNP